MVGDMDDVMSVSAGPDDVTEPSSNRTAAIFLTTPIEFKVAYIVVGGFGMAGNLMVLVVIFSFSHMRSSFTNKFIANQSLIDFVVSLSVVLTNIIRYQAPRSLGDGLAQELYCKLWMPRWPLWGTFISSTYNLVALTFERYYGIVYPLHHSHHFTNRKAYIIMAVVWLWGLGFHASYGVSTTKRIGGQCVRFQYPSKATQRAVGMLVIIIQYIIPILAITLANIRIFHTLQKSFKGSPVGEDDVREERMKRARRNVVKTLLKVFICFFCCWTPNQIFFSAYNFGYELIEDPNFYHCTILLIFVNCFINSVVYTLSYEQFQSAQRQLFCSCLTKAGGPERKVHYATGGQKKSESSFSDLGPSLNETVHTTAE